MIDIDHANYQTFSSLAWLGGGHKSDSQYDRWRCIEGLGSLASCDLTTLFDVNAKNEERRAERMTKATGANFSFHSIFLREVFFLSFSFTLYPLW